MSVSQFEGERVLESVTAPIYRSEVNANKHAKARNVETMTNETLRSAVCGPVPLSVVAKWKRCSLRCMYLCCVACSSSCGHVYGCVVDSTDEPTLMGAV